jgi:hypothetical protein
MQLITDQLAQNIQLSEGTHGITLTLKPEDLIPLSIALLLASQDITVAVDEERILKAKEARETE